MCLAEGTAATYRQGLDPYEWLVRIRSVRRGARTTPISMRTRMRERLEQQTRQHQTTTACGLEFFCHLTPGPLMSALTPASPPSAPPPPPSRGHGGGGEAEPRPAPRHTTGGPAGRLAGSRG